MLRLTLVTTSLTCAVLVASVGCARKSDPSAASLEPSGSEVAVSVVSGALNNTSASIVAINELHPPKSSPFQRAIKALNPVSTAWAADWACTGGSLAPTFAGPAKNPYAFTPRSCSVTWGEDETGSSTWSGPFTLNYGSACDALHPSADGQVAGCSITRTTGASGDTRTITGPDGNSYAITHDTDGAGTGWDSSVTPAPGNGGVALTLGEGDGAVEDALVIHGSRLTGTVSIDGATLKIWDHTVSTGASGITVSGVGTNRIVSGSVTVQHNILRFTSETTFDAVGYGDAACCFPTSGSVSTTFSKGIDVGKTETLSFSAACGEATLKPASGTSVPLVLQNCL
jgi:hypothetical protein